MLAALPALPAGGAAFGLVPNLVLTRLGAPAAASRLSGGSYPHRVLTGTVALPVRPLDVDYTKPDQLSVIAGTVLLGLLLARRCRHRPGPQPVRPVRAPHTGSVHDYAALAVVGVGCALFVLLL